MCFFSLVEAGFPVSYLFLKQSLKTYSAGWSPQRVLQPIGDLLFGEAMRVF
jgi:hypothetical protein